jgi:hypothetical protein
MLNEIEDRREKGGLQGYELKMEFARARQGHASQEELDAINRKIIASLEKIEVDVQNITKQWERMKSEKQMELRFHFEASRWLRTRKSKLAAIKSRFTQELKALEKLQAVELRELFPPPEDSEVDLEESSEEPPDLNAAIIAALAEHAAPTSPADCPFLKVYGDYGHSVESTRSEKSGVKDWNLLGIRGLEAIQVSSHRGPPTDRPPDIPPPAVGVFAGCLQERVDTRHLSQLASFSRGSHCSSGNASSVADNAIWGSRAIGQCRVRAAGSSHGSRAELEACEVWSVQGQRGTCVTSCHPPQNLGRNLFPPRRFSYHTQVSGFNGTARQPSLLGS